MQILKSIKIYLLISSKSRSAIFLRCISVENIIKQSLKIMKIRLNENKIYTKNKELESIKKILKIESKIENKIFSVISMKF